MRKATFELAARQVYKTARSPKTRIERIEVFGTGVCRTTLTCVGKFRIEQVAGVLCDEWDGGVSVDAPQLLCRRHEPGFLLQLQYDKSAQRRPYCLRLSSHFSFPVFLSYLFFPGCRYR